MAYNQDAWRMVEEKVTETANASSAAAFANISAGKGSTLPTKSDYVGQLFVKTGSDAGLYVSTGTTTPGWKTVTHAQ